MDFSDVVRRRRMVRNFDDRPLSTTDVDRLLAAAAQGPSAGFTQGVDLLALEGPEETARFLAASGGDGERSRAAWPGVARAPLMVVVLSSEAAYRDRYAEADKARSALAGGRPWPVPYWHVDAAFAAMLLLLAAVDLGLGALFFAVADADGLRAEFGVPPEWAPVGAVAVGHPATDRPSGSLSRGRRPLDEVVHRGRW
ncbi:MAG: nitroreductase family protein [Acidimicrobiales bacterium]